MAKIRQMGITEENLIDSNTVSKKDMAITVLIILSFALLPVGRTVEIPTIILSLIGLVVLIRNRSFFLRPDSAVRLFLLIFMLIWLPMLLSVIGSENVKKSALFTLKYLRFLFVGLLTIYMLKNRIIKVWVLHSLSIVVIFWLLDSAVQWLSGTDLLGRSYDGSRITGPFRKLHMPVFLSIMLPLVWVFIGLKWKKYVFIPIVILSIWILFLAGSRASVIVTLYGAMLFSGYVFFKARKKPWLPVFLLTGVLAIIAFTGYHYDQAFKARVDQTSLLLKGDYQSINIATSYRLPIWEAAYNMGADHPINGFGIKNFRDGFHQYEPADSIFKNTGALHPALHPHLFFLETFAETGSIGIMAMLLIPVLLYRFCAKEVKMSSPIQIVSVITLLMIFFPLNSHVSLYGSVYSQVAWLLSAISCACLVDEVS